MTRNNPIFEYLLAAIMIGCLLLAMFGCRAQQPIVQTVEVEHVVEIRTRDTAIVTQADSASMRALLRCDSAYNVILDELVTMQGDRIEAEIQMEHLQAGAVQIRMDCHEDSLWQLIQLQDSIIRTTQTNTVVVTKKYVPSYYKNCTTGFWILLAVLLIISAWYAAKLYFKIQSGGLTNFFK